MKLLPWPLYVVEASAVLGYQWWMAGNIDGWGHFFLGFLFALTVLQALFSYDRQ